MAQPEAPFYTIDNLRTVLEAGIVMGAPKTAGSPLDVVMLPRNYTLQSVEGIIGSYRDNPRNIKSVVSLADLESFAAYVKQFKTDGSRIFASIGTEDSPPIFTCIVDGHVPGAPSWQTHRAVYAPAYTVEWNRIMTLDGSRMTQTNLCEFLEENARLIVEPSGADLLELAMTLEGKNNITCNQMIRLTNGRCKMEYSEDVSVQGTMGQKSGVVEFPTQMKLALQPFYRGLNYAVHCRMRYRIASKRLEFWFNTIDVHLIVQNVVEEIITTITEKTGLQPLIGTTT